MSNSNNNTKKNNTNKKNNSSTKKSGRSEAALARRAAKAATQKAERIAKQTAKKEAKTKRVMNMFPNILGIVAAQGFMPNVKKTVLVSKSLSNTLKTVPLFQNADRSTIYPNGMTLLNKYLEDHNWNKAMEILNLGVPKRVLETPLSTGEMPLYHVFLFNQFDLFKKMLEKGANPNYEYNINNKKIPFISFLIGAFQTSEYILPYLEELINYKADINKLDSHGFRPIEKAIHFDYSDQNLIANLLIEKGALLETPNNKGYTPVLTAIAHSKRNILKKMVEKGIDINKVTGQKKKLFPLKIAALNGKKEILEDVIKYGAELNKRDEEGNTALHYAVLAKAYDKMKILKEAGAVSNLSNNKGVTAFQLAQALEQAGNPQAYNILKA